MRVRQCDRSIAAAFLHCGQALLKSLELLHRSPSVPQNAAVTAARAVCAHDAAEDDAAAPALAGAPALAVAPTLAGTGTGRDIAAQQCVNPHCPCVFGVPCPTLGGLLDSAGFLRC